MRYRSTSGKAPLTSLRGATLRGLAPDGGLYLPVEIARHTPEELEEFRRLPFTEVCFRVVRPFATPDVPEEVLWQIVAEAINFPVKLVSLSPALHILELFHGPTLAFKDFGARFMARLMGYFVRGEERQLTVLVATSGDTGVPGIRVVILYPSKRISEAQEKQFTTLGENITALEVSGTFDDCQRLVKQAFSDEALNHRAFLTSANSINVARLLPQMFYHVAAYRQLPVASVPLIVSVPSGNFGNLTAGLFAKRLGLPVSRFIAATNANDAVPRYLLSGEYRPNEAVATYSNAMDVGNPNNFPRLLDYAATASKMSAKKFGDRASPTKRRCSRCTTCGTVSAISATRTPRWAFMPGKPIARRIPDHRKAWCWPQRIPPNSPKSSKRALALPRRSLRA